MIEEIKVKFYNKDLGAGYNDFRQVFCEKTNAWIPIKVHAGRLVYGRERKPFSRLRNGITNHNHIVRAFIPF